MITRELKKKPFIDPELAVESIGEVPRVPRAHLEVEFAQTLVRFAPPLYWKKRRQTPHKKHRMTKRLGKRSRWATVLSDSVAVIVVAVVAYT